MFSHEKFIPASPSVRTDHMVTSIIERSACSKDIFCMFNEIGCHHSYFPYTVAGKGKKRGRGWRMGLKEKVKKKEKPDSLHVHLHVDVRA